MISVTATVTVYAVDDAEADEVLQGIMRLGSKYPSTPIVNVVGERREFSEA